MKLEIEITEQELEMLDGMFDHFYFNSDDMTDEEKAVFFVLRKKHQAQAAKLFDAFIGE